MCKIEEVPSFKLNGTLYDTREKAVTAGLTEIASDIQRNHVNDVLKGIITHKAALIYLLGLHESPPTDTPKSS
jgi:hypothetical protein